MKKNTNTKFYLDWKDGILITIILGIIAFTFLKAIITNRNIKKNTIETNLTEISNIEFNMLPYVIANIPETDTTPGFIVRAGYQNDYKLAFNDYKNNNIYVLNGYNLYGTFEDSLLDKNYGFFAINRDLSSIDNIVIDGNKPSVKNSLHIENLSKFIGSDKENNLLFLTTKENELLCYDLKTNNLVNYNSDNLDFKKIHTELKEKGNIIDFLFLENYILPDGKTEKGIYLSYQNNKDKKIVDKFYKFNFNNFTFEEL